MQRRKLLVAKGLALLAGAAFVLAACGGGQESETAANQSDVVPIEAEEQPQSAPPSDATYTVEEAQDAYRQYVRCMQDEGAPMPPAAFGPDGKIDLDADFEYFESLTAEDAATFSAAPIDFEAADGACRPEDAEALFAVIAPDEGRARELESQFGDQLSEQMTALAQCMRLTFPDFPDPVLPDLSTAEEGVINPFPGIDQDDPRYEQSFLECADEIGLGVGRAPGAGS